MVAKDHILRFTDRWMLPSAIVAGISIYLIYHFSPALYYLGPVFNHSLSEGQRLLIAILMFFQFVKMSPGDVLIRKWHLKALSIQVAACIVLGFLSVAVPAGLGRILLQSAMLCFICPTASAAGVITDRLGGSLAGTVTYLVIIDVAASFIIPAMIPVVHPAEGLSFWIYMVRIAGRIMPMLILPGILAWTIRYTLPGLQRILRPIADYSVMIWGIALTIAMILATRALVTSDLSPWSLVLIGLTASACCAIQFAAGRTIGKKSVSPDGKSDRNTAGQALGQKNTGFLIWLGYTALTPVTAIAGGIYAIVQNLFNTWELRRYGSK